MKTASAKLAYLLITSPTPNVYMGGLMVTDDHGLPLEFRYTEPIQPTRIQQVLYGQALAAYIKQDVILETLLKNVEARFKALFVEDPHFLDYPAKGYTVFRISGTKSPPIGDVGIRQTLNPQESLLQITPEGAPLRVSIGHGQAAGQNGGQGGEPSEPIDSEKESKPDPFQLLMEVGQTMDLTEPLKRIERALEIICSEAGLTQTGNPAR